MTETVDDVLRGRDLWELIGLRVAATPDARTAIDERGASLSFGELAARAETVAAGLAERGIGADDVVSWMLPTWLDSLVLCAAISRLGAVQNPIIPIYRGREVEFCTRQAGTKLLVVPSIWRGFDYAAMAGEVAGRVDGLDVLVCDRGGLPVGDPAALADPAPAVDDGPMRWLMYTSGTTSDPKGAKHRDASIAAIGLAMGERLGCGLGDRSALVFPFTHIGGITWLFTSLQFGVVNVIDEAFDPSTTVELLRREDVHYAGSGTYFHTTYLAAQQAEPDAPIFPSLKCCPGGGAPKPPQLHYDVKEQLGGAGVVSGWGLTEAPILTMGALDDPDDKLAETEGRPMPGVDLRVVAFDGSLAAPGDEGELRAKAPQLMMGYLDSSLDDEAFDDDGYFRTGDLGIQDAEGYVVITGRLKDVIIRHGENISAKEVEDLLYQHAAVQDVAVVGLADETTGERACAVVASAEGAEPLGLAAMATFLRDAGLRTQAIPEQLVHIDAIPRNASGKITKNVLREQLADEPFSRG